MTDTDDPIAADAEDVAAHPSVQRVRTRLTELGATGRVHVLTEAVRTADLAAQALGVEVGQIANSLVFATREEEDSDPSPLLVLASGAHRVDVHQVADLLGVAAVDRADPDLVRAATGFPIGGVAPVGHPEPLHTLVDVSLARYDVVWAAAGHPRTVFPTSYDELVRITGGHPAEVT